MAKKPKKSKAQASPAELMEQRVGQSMATRGDRLMDAGVAELTKKLGTDQTQYYSDIAGADEAQSRANAPGLDTLEGDFTKFSNNVRGVFDAKRRAREAGLAENLNLRKAILDTGDKKGNQLQGLSTLSRLAASNTVADMRNKQSQYAATAGALGTLAGGGIAADWKPAKWWTGE
tara:strand:+ start:2478 stop:3002 length:525 start_codon:yes stop_codon:yes gene_type:complete